MGEVKRKQETRETVLRRNPLCCFCGDTATTVDHCPPRSLFRKRQWPEDFQFSACQKCNSQARLDDQLIAVLLRVSLKKKTDDEHNEWASLVDGLRNNQPAVLEEWAKSTPAANKRLFRERFGSDADVLRYAGYGTLSVGPLTKSALQRFVVRLAQALYYRHCGEALDGVVYVFHLDPFAPKLRDGGLQDLLKFVPRLELPTRSGSSLQEQFHYRFNCSDEVGALSAIVRFSEQMIFQVLAVRRSAFDEIERRASVGDTPRWESGIQIRLRKPVQPAVN